MAARKKKLPADMRTVDLFTGKKTRQEEIEDLVREEDEFARESPVERRTSSVDLIPRQEETAIRWLGLDPFHEGDDVRVAVHPKGHAVLCLVNTRGGTPFSTREFKLTKQQWEKLQKIVRES